MTRWFFLLIFCFGAGASGNAGSLQIAVISDLNGSYGSTKYGRDVSAAIKRIIELRPDLVIVTGDMIAGQRVSPKLSRSQLNLMWQSFDRNVRRPLKQAQIPLLVTPGNHDASAYGGFDAERRVYAETWHSWGPELPLADGQNFPFYYSAKLENVLFVSLDVTTVGSLPREQMNWLKGQIEDVSSRPRATILFSHLPLWPVAENRERETIGDPALQALLTSSGVELYLSGHHHAYYPGVNSGVLFVAQSCLGGGSRRLIGSSRRAQKSFTIIEIDEAGKIDQYALAAPAFVNRIDLSSLPRSIGSGRSKLIRSDLAR